MRGFQEERTGSLGSDLGIKRKFDSQVGRKTNQIFYKICPDPPKGSRGGVMVDLKNVGQICLNEARKGECVNCLWWEWNAANKRCGNSQTHVCPTYRGTLFQHLGTHQILRQPSA